MDRRTFIGSLAGGPRRRAARGAPAPITGPVLLGAAAGVMVSLLFYSLLVTDPPVAYIVGVLATAGVTAWAALECLFCDWADRNGDGDPIPHRSPSPAAKPGGPGVGQVGSVHAPVRPTRLVGADVQNASPFSRRPPTR